MHSNAAYSMGKKELLNMESLNFVTWIVDSFLLCVVILIISICFVVRFVSKTCLLQVRISIRLLSDEYINTIFIQNT